MNPTDKLVLFFNRITYWKDSWLVGFFVNLFNWWQNHHPDSFQWFKANWLQPRLMNAANILSFSRGGVVPFLIFLIIMQWKWWAFLLCLIAGITDLIDGAIAKAGQCVTEKGSIIDPFMDKLLFISLIIAVQLSYLQPLWLPLIITAIIGEVINSSIRVYKIKNKIRPYDATSTGKAKFISQMAVIYLLLLPIQPTPAYHLFANCLLGLSTLFLSIGLVQERKNIISWKKMTP